mmetsp:Transcript_15501/g.37516  ORF Transcript_15501/g.37516 Transcript_15501/m.37516 type:complete len:314 (-) Transcript_15501:377-1318(-)
MNPDPDPDPGDVGFNLTPPPSLLWLPSQNPGRCRGRRSTRAHSGQQWCSHSSPSSSQSQSQGTAGSGASISGPICRDADVVFEFFGNGGGALSGPCHPIISVRRCGGRRINASSSSSTCSSSCSSSLSSTSFAFFSFSSLPTSNTSLTPSPSRAIGLGLELGGGGGSGMTPCSSPPSKVSTRPGAGNTSQPRLLFSRLLLFLDAPVLASRQLPPSSSSCCCCGSSPSARRSRSWRVHRRQPSPQHPRSAALRDVEMEHARRRSMEALLRSVFVGGRRHATQEWDGPRRCVSARTGHRRRAHRCSQCREEQRPQ